MSGKASPRDRDHHYNHQARHAAAVPRDPDAIRVLARVMAEHNNAEGAERKRRILLMPSTRRALERAGESLYEYMKAPWSSEVCTRQPIDPGSVGPTMGRILSVLLGLAHHPTWTALMMASSSSSSSPARLQSDEAGGGGPGSGGDAGSMGEMDWAASGGACMMDAIIHSTDTCEMLEQFCSFIVGGEEPHPDLTRALATSMSSVILSLARCNVLEVARIGGGGGGF